MFLLVGCAVLAEATLQRATPVEKVVTMVKELQTQVQDEGKKEAHMYDKFACFCKSKTDEKTAAIGEGETAVDTLIADLGTLTADRDQLNVDINGLNEDIASYEDQLKNAKALREDERTTFEKAFEDMSRAVTALEKATKQLKASKTTVHSSLVSVQSTVRKSLLMADVLGMKPMNEKVVTALLADPGFAPPSADYEFHSGDVVDTLEGLLGTFRQKKTDLEAADTQAQSDHALAEQGKEDQKATAQTTLEMKQAELSKTTEKIGTTQADLTGKNAVLNDDRLYLQDLTSKCESKAKQWDQRSAMRADELSTLTQALAVLEGTVANKASATGSGGRHAKALAQVAFVQVQTVQARKASPEDDLQRTQIVQLLRQAGKRLQSHALVTLAMKVAEDPFKKITGMIQEMIERLLQEEADEATHKGWCDTEMTKTTKKRDNHLRNVEELHSSLEQMNARKGSLEEDQQELEAAIAELQADLQTETEDRADESAENAQTVSEAKDGVAAIAQAMDILSHFYGKAAKAQVVELVQGVDDDAPDDGMGDGAYTGSQAASGGILGMMEVIQSDFERTISDTEAAEEQAKRDFVALNRDASVSINTKQTAHDNTVAELTEVTENIGTADDDLRTQQGLLDTTVEALSGLASECANGGADQGMSYEERVQRRNAEVAALRDAYCILNNEEAGCSGVFLQKRVRL